MIPSSIYLFRVQSLSGSARSVVVLNATDESTAEALVTPTLGPAEVIDFSRQITKHVYLKPGETTLIDASVVNTTAIPGNPKELVANALGVSPDLLSGTLTFTTTQTVNF